MISNVTIVLMGCTLVVSVCAIPMLRWLAAQLREGRSVPIYGRLPEANIVRYDPYSGTLRAIKDKR